MREKYLDETNPEMLQLTTKDKQRYMADFDSDDYDSFSETEEEDLEPFKASYMV